MMEKQVKNHWNTVLWVCMVLLVLCAFWFAEGLVLASSGVLIFILAVMTIKFVGIGFQFMELKHAHKVWQVLFSIFIVLMTSLIWIIV